MTKLLEDMTARDINQWLHGTFAVHAGILYRFIAVNEETREVELELTTSRIKRLIVPHTEVETWWPLCGSVNVPEWGVAVHVQRDNAKVYTRSYNSEVLEVRMPDKWRLLEYLPEKVTTSNEFRRLHAGSNSIANACFAPRYAAHAQARELLISGNVLSVALCPSVILSATAGPRGPWRVYYKAKYIADLSGYELSGLVVNRAIEQRLRKLLLY